MTVERFLAHDSESRRRRTFWERSSLPVRVRAALAPARLANSYYGAFGPHFGFAYSKDSKTVVRGSYARSFGAITTVSGSTHNMGFTLTQSFNNTSGGLYPTFLFDQGLPPWTAPPFIDPSVSNGAILPGFRARKRPDLRSSIISTFLIQRQIGGSMVVEAGYNGVMGSHLQSQLLGYNQVNRQAI